MDYGGSAPMFKFADNIDSAKLFVLFVVDGVVLSLLLFISRLQPNTTLERMRVIINQGAVWIFLAILLSCFQRTLFFQPEWAFDL